VTERPYEIGDVVDIYCDEGFASLEESGIVLVRSYRRGKRGRQQRWWIGDKNGQQFRFTHECIVERTLSEQQQRERSMRAFFPTKVRCEACRETGLIHCQHPNECGNMVSVR
jgi:hypothetical protein